MAKATTQFTCQACGALFPSGSAAARRAARGTPSWRRLRCRSEVLSHPSSSRAQRVGDVDADHAARIPDGHRRADRVLGGGAVLGGVTLVGGDPGVGKSTLLMQALGGLASLGHRSLYVSGEESAGQTAARARRLGAVHEELLVLAENERGRD